MAANTIPYNTGYTAIMGTTTGNNGYRTDTWVEYKVTGQNEVNNTSTVKVYLYSQAQWDSGTVHESTGKYGYVQIDSNKQEYTMTGGYNFHNQRLNKFAEYTFENIAHNSDGTKTVTISGAWSDPGWTTWISGGSASGTVTLPTIARKSSFAIASGTKYLGTAFNVNITSQSDAFYHKLTLAFGGQTDYINITHTTNKTLQQSVTVPTAWATEIPNATSGTLILTLTTYSNSSRTTAIGSVSSTLTINIPSDWKPTIGTMTFAEADSTMISKNWGVYVKTKSKVKVTLGSISLNTGASIASYKITSTAGHSSTAATYTTDYLQTSGTITFTATVTDSRGRTSSAKTGSISVYNYSAPTLTNVSVFRCDSTGQRSDSGTCGQIKATLTTTAVSVNNVEKNTPTLRYRIKSPNGWGSWTNFASNTQVIIEDREETTTYDVEIEGGDAFTTVTTSGVITSSSRIININADGNGVAFGGFSSGNYLESYWPLLIHNGTVTTNNGLTVNGYDMLHSLLYRSTLTSADDLDDLYGKYNQGYYYVNGSTPSNSPFTSSSVWTILVVLGGTGGYTQQLFVDNRGGINPFVWMRQRSGNPQQWGSWVGAPRYDSVFFLSGDTYGPATAVLGGYITASGKEIDLAFNLPERTNLISTLTVTTLTGVIRGNSGYVNSQSSSYNWLSDSSITVTASKYTDTMIVVKLVKTSAFSNVTTDTPVCFRGSVGLTLT